MILPDKAKVRFESTGPLVKYLNEVKTEGVLER